ncbi:hypothetical protein BKA70DRAFT_1756 [Coprinopsis sp. MPI-PUGE-AT-0042]|nr:hypothetical protein BKA70DRAFT_1756 [Coprinopsis sp. MPI-PUGE-AT-0042]
MLIFQFKAVSCSKLTGEHLLRMGITTFEAARGDFDPLKVGEHGSEAENLDDQDESEGEQDGSIDADLDGFWRQELRSTFGFLQVCKKLIGNRNEAGGPRHSIFYMLTLVVRIAEHRGALTIIHNELSLGSSRAKDQELEGIIAIIFDNKATLLTGIADFMIFSSEEVNAEEGEAARQGATDANSLFQVTKFFEKFEYVCFLLEAKRPMSSSTQLIQYLPQVVGQCVMIMKRNE